MKKTLRSWPTRLLFLFFVIFIFLDVLGYLKPVENVLDSKSFSFNLGGIHFSIYLLIKAVLTILILAWATHIFLSFSETRIQNMNNLNTSNKALLIKLCQIFVYFLAFMIGLRILGIDLTALAIFSGAIGIGLGFGLQKIASNFISGLILLFEKSIKYNDMIELPDGTSGFVRYTGARYTLIEAYDGKEMMIPNENFMTNRVTNWTYSNKKAQIDISINVSYSSDLEKASELMIEAATEHPLCMKNPGPSCFLKEFRDPAVKVSLSFWIEDVTQGRSKPQSEVMLAIWKKFKAHDIKISVLQQNYSLL